MIQVNNLSKQYGPQTLFDGISFALGAGERLGIVGRNGHGKSTLFRIILGEEDIDAGNIAIPKNYSIGHLSQRLDFKSPTVLEEASLALPKQEGGWIETHKAEAILHGLGFSNEDCKRPPSELSGGFQVRLSLTKLLVSNPNLLLLDEPTNYLDIVSVRWLIQFLRSWDGELMLITHDRSFMDKVCTHTMAIHRHGVKKIEGSTTKLYQQIAQEEEIHEKTRLNQQKKREKAEEFITRFRAKASKASAAQSRVKALEKMEQLEALTAIQNLSFQFNVQPFIGKFLLHAKNLSFHFKDSKPLFENLQISVGKHDRIGVIGKNGKGKTTLLRLLAGELKPNTGSIEYSPNAKLAYYGQTNVDRLRPNFTVEEEILSAAPDISRTVARSLCGGMMFEGDAALKRVQVLSGGERSRVLLGKVLAEPTNLLYLDEPTNHLDMQSSEALLQAIKKFPNAVIIVTHDEHFLRKLANRLIVFDGGKVTLFEGGYNDFLRQVGWQGEASDAKEKTVLEKPLSKKELRRLRAEKQEQRRALLRPLEKKIVALEKKITEKEEQLKTDQAELIEITKEGFSDKATKLFREVHQNQEEIEALFEELATVTQEKETALGENGDN